MSDQPGIDGFVALRSRCGCGCNVGRVGLVGGQLTVRCADCNKFAFNAPQASLGLPLAAPKPVRLASRYAGRCRDCGAEHEQGNWVFWIPKTQGVMCPKCNDAGGGQ